MRVAALPRPRGCGAVRFENGSCGTYPTETVCPTETALFVESSITNHEPFSTAPSPPTAPHDVQTDSLEGSDWSNGSSCSHEPCLTAPHSNGHTPPQPTAVSNPEDCDPRQSFALTALLTSFRCSPTGRLAIARLPSRSFAPLTKTSHVRGQAAPRAPDPVAQPRGALLLRRACRGLSTAPLLR